MEKAVIIWVNWKVYHGLFNMDILRILTKNVVSVVCACVSVRAKANLHAQI